MESSQLAAATWQRLVQRASAENCSVDELLTRWLDGQAASTSPPSAPLQQVPIPTELDREDTLALALRSAQAGIWVWEIETNAIRWDAAMEAMHGLSVGSFGGSFEAWRECVHPEDRENAVAAVQAALRDECDFNHGFRVVWPDGTVRHILGQGVVTRDAATGQPMHMIGVNTDITRRVEAEQTLRRSEAQLRWLVQNMPVLIDAFDSNNQITVWNQECERVTGYRADEVMGDPLVMERLYPDPEYRNSVIADAVTYGDQLHRREYTLTAKDGTPRTISWSHIPAPYGHTGSTIWAVGIDVTEQRRAEASLRANEEKYRLLVEYSHQGMMIAQHDPLRLRFASRPMHAITGYTPDELLAFDSEPLQNLVHPDDRERFLADLRAHMEDEDAATGGRYRIIHRDGSLRHIDLYSARIDYDGQAASQATVLDVTAQVEAERLKTRFQKEQEHNALVQRVISMLSHDMRTPLSIIASARDILRDYNDRLTDADRVEKLDSIGRQVQFAVELLEDTLDTVRGPLNRRDYDPRPIHLATLCRVSVEEIESTHDNGKHEISFVNRGDVDIVAVDEILVSRILVNLLSNAIKYSPDGGPIQLELDRDDSWIILRVSDEGLGIREEDLPRIFDPFYRTDEVHGIHGTGLGLSIVKDCVERHQGRIYAESRLGEGTTFTVELPC